MGGSLTLFSNCVQITPLCLLRIIPLGAMTPPPAASCLLIKLGLAVALVAAHLGGAVVPMMAPQGARWPGARWRRALAALNVFSGAALLATGTPLN